MWFIDITYIEDWLDSQDKDTVAHIFSALEVLQEAGPSLGRPLVDTLREATVSNLKELRPPSPGATEVRIIFAFDPKRRAIMLLGGDKASGVKKSRWNKWYKTAIPRAESIYMEHLRGMES